MERVPRVEQRQGRSAQTGAATLAQSHTPYGELLATEGEATTSYAFTGEALDAYTGLTYLRARWYGPAWGRFLSRDVWRGNVYDPLSLNRWIYTKANPVNFTDPSGFITEAEASAADVIRNKLETVYRVILPKDYGWRPAGSQGYGQCQDVWFDGSWRNLDEIKWVYDAIKKVATEMGGAKKFKSAMKREVVVARWDVDKILWLYTVRGFAPPFKISGDIVLPNSTLNSGKMGTEYTVAHELAHVWDWRTSNRLSTELMIFMDTMVCDFNGDCYFDIWAGKEDPPGDVDKKKNYAATDSMEDWAEAFASTMYPLYYDRAGYRRIGSLREQFVLDKIKQLP